MTTHRQFSGPTRKMLRAHCRALWVSWLASRYVAYARGATTRDDIARDAAEIAIQGYRLGGKRGLAHVARVLADATTAEDAAAADAERVGSQG